MRPKVRPTTDSAPSKAEPLPTSPGSRATTSLKAPLAPAARPAVLAATVLLLSSAATAYGQEVGEREPIIGGPCEGCEGVFQGLPADLSSVARIAPEDEPGEPMRIEGTVYDGEGNPAPGVIVYAYQTNAEGVYPPNEAFEGKAAYRHGLLRGWAITDDEGRYRFDTIRPASYPDREIPAHVHMHVIEVGCCTYYLDSVHFTDDPLLDEQELDEDGRGGSGLVKPERDEDGTWIVERDIVLGRGVPGYPRE